MSDIVKKDHLAVVDNFGGWEDRFEGDDRPDGAGIIQGTLLKFSNEAAWVARDGDELPAHLELVAVDVARVVQKWVDQQPVETIILEPHQKFPDIEEMNAKVPREEWVDGPDGHPRGPWQAQHILYLLDAKSMGRFSYPTGTTGGRIAIGELRDKLVWMRRLRGPNVYPAVLLDNTFMRTRFGGRQRPHFNIVRWVRLGGEGGEVEALPPPVTTQPAPATQASAASDLQSVQAPSLAEEMNDSIDDLPGLGTAETPPKKPPKKPAKAPSKKRPTNLLDAG